MKLPLPPQHDAPPSLAYFIAASFALAAVVAMAAREPLGAFTFAIFGSVFFLWDRNHAD